MAIEAGSHRKPSEQMRDLLLLIDVFDDFEHEDGVVLAASFLRRLPNLKELVATARAAEIPIAYANDRHGCWHGDVGRFVARVTGPTTTIARPPSPRPDDAFFFKDQYSAFDRTALDVLLAELRVERLIVAGMSLEGCVTQTAIAARERGFLVTVVEPACARIDEAGAEVAAEYLRRIVGARIVSGAASQWRDMLGGTQPPDSP